MGFWGPCGVLKVPMGFWGSVMGFWESVMGFWGLCGVLGVPYGVCVVHLGSGGAAFWGAPPLTPPIPYRIPPPALW